MITSGLLVIRQEQCWLLSHANGTRLRGLLGSEGRRENSKFREVEMTNIMTEAVSTPDVTK